MPIRDRIREIKHLQNKNFICVLEEPKNVVNIASAMRNISAFGVEKLYVIGSKKHVKDFETSRKDKKLANVSVGANKWVFVKQFNNTEECIKHLRSKGFTIAVTSSHIKGKNNVDLYRTAFTQKKLAVWFGNESKGISDVASKEADMCIQIPMGGIVESLNLGTSTGVVLGFISYQRLQYVFENKKVKFKPRGAGYKKMVTWDDFINPHRDY